MATIYDIAKKANVSPMTVSRVINHSKLVSEPTRRKVQQTIKSLNYIPNKTARSLVLKESKLLSLIITDITNPFFNNIARGAEDKALQMGYQLLLSNSDESIEKESNYIKLLISTGVDGVLICPTGDGSGKNLKTLTKYNVPFVLLDREVKGIECDLVLVDNHEAIRKLINHLIEQGHEKIALINGPTHISNAREREKAYREVLTLNSLPIDEALIFATHYIQDSTSEIISSLLSLSSKKRPTAIVATNNFVGVNTIKALRKHRMNVPRDIAVVCFDDPEPISDFNPFLTVASQPAYSFGSMGTQLLIERIEETAPKQYRKIVLSPELLIRESSLKKD
jgi:LacI family transcriptional regulator